MGKIGKGILGGVSGKVGNVVGASWKGIDYIRSKPLHVKNSRTEGQVKQRTKFNLVLRFLQPNLGFIQVGYKNYTNKKSQFNSAMSYILNNAITGTSPLDYAIDYSLALLSRGMLSSALNGTTDLTTAGQVDFSWDDNSTDSNANATDKSMLVVFNSDKTESVYITEGPDRSTGLAIVNIPDSWSGDTVELFMAFINEDGTLVSNSNYLGSGTAS
ncbi:MAG: DUF6266 family protein [Moheibacter sp.]